MKKTRSTDTDKPKRIAARQRTLILTTTGMLTAVGVLLPQIFHAVPNAVFVLLPMHIPVLICGLLCGPLWGGLCGVITTAVSSFAFGMPVIPTGLVPMLFEMLAYGVTAGALYRVLTRAPVVKGCASPLALVIAMILGRIVSVSMHMLLLSLIMGGNAKTVLLAALSGAFVFCWPGIVIQLVFIPMVMLTLRKTGILVKYATPADK